MEPNKVRSSFTTTVDEQQLDAHDQVCRSLHYAQAENQSVISVKNPVKDRWQ